jgi:hypothetical protein
MAITREFTCAAHGPFESKRTNPKCPKGCSARFVTQEFRTAPAIGGVARHVDRELNHLAKDYRLTDIRNTAAGDSVMTTLRKGTNWAPSWGDVTHAEPGFSQRGEKSPTVSPAAYGASPTGALQSVKPLLTQPKPIIEHSYKADVPT